MEKVQKYTAKQLAKSEKFYDRTDVLLAVLDENGLYTPAEAEKAVDDYLKRRVM